MKRLTALIISFCCLISVFTMSSCKKENEEKTQSLTQNLTREQTQEHTQEQTQAPATSQTAEPLTVWLEPTAEDWDALILKLANLSHCMDDAENFTYYYKDKKDVEKVYGLLTHPLSRIYRDIFGDNETPENRADHTSADPLNRIGYEYETYSADNLDWIIKNVFNTTPNHEYGEICYYYGDKFYNPFNLTGGGGEGFEYVSKDKNSDGTFTVVAKTVNNEWVGNYLHLFTVNAGVKNVDGKRIWSFNEIERTVSEN